METPETAADMAARDAPLRSVRRAIMGSSRIYADCCGDTNYTARRPAPPEWRPRMRSIDPLRSDPPEVSIHPLDGAHECRALGIETLRVVQEQPLVDARFRYTVARSFPRKRQLDRAVDAAGAMKQWVTRDRHSGLGSPSRSNVCSGWSSMPSAAEATRFDMRIIAQEPRAAASGNID